MVVLEDTSVHFGSEAGVITGIGLDTTAEGTIDARGLLVLPGIVDVHGDAFERQVMPRPRVAFPLDIALLESDRQAVSNGITTVFHGVTWSWEPGLRGAENARAILAGIERIRPRLGADTRYHLRHETYNLDAEPEITEWLPAAASTRSPSTIICPASSRARTRAHKLAPRSSVPD